MCYIRGANLRTIRNGRENFHAALKLKIKELFAVMHLQSHLSGSRICKHESFSPLHLLFALANLVFLHIKTVRDLLDPDPGFELISTLSPIVFITFS
jgi:hypothetical protein